MGGSTTLPQDMFSMDVLMQDPNFKAGMAAARLGVLRATGSFQSVSDWLQSEWSKRIAMPVLVHSNSASFAAARNVLDYTLALVSGARSDKFLYSERSLSGR